MTDLFLEQNWVDGPANGVLTLTLHNLGPVPLSVASFAYTALGGPMAASEITGGAVVRRIGSYNEFHTTTGAPHDLAAGGHWRLRIAGLTREPLSRVDGAMTARVTLTDGTQAMVTVGDLAPPAGASRGPQVQNAAALPPVPLALVPWPANVAIDAYGGAPLLVMDPADPGAAILNGVVALFRRLFVNLAQPFGFAAHSGDERGDTRALITRHDAAVAPEGYAIAFTPDAVHLRHGGPLGLRHGLVTLAQIAQAAQVQPGCAIPLTGLIKDAPRFGWRGCMLDVSRNFIPADRIIRHIDIMAWLRMNRFHWHLTDDEAWRIESLAFPALHDIGATRGPDAAIPPQSSDGIAGQTGYYRQSEIREIVAHAAALGIEIMPEVDIPGHSYAILMALPQLADPAEQPDSYRSVHNFPNNALNPALPATHDFLHKMLNEVCDLFPFDIFHIGGDEVETGAWMTSPEVDVLKEHEGITGTLELQMWLLRKVQTILAARGRRIAGWDECADAGGVDGALLFAWRSIDKTAELLARGYDVISVPGQSYYLDMRQATGWDEPGAGWAGVTPLAATYGFDPATGLPDATDGLLGVHTAVWTEHIGSVDRFNHLVFPRMAAVAEAGWSPADSRDPARFQVAATLVPRH